MGARGNLEGPYPGNPGQSSLGKCLPRGQKGLKGGACGDRGARGQAFDMVFDELNELYCVVRQSML